MREPILVIDAGSSSVKFSLFETATNGSLAAGAHGRVEGIGLAARFAVTNSKGRKLAEQPLAGHDHKAAIAAIHDWFTAYGASETSFAAIGLRVVHGGSEFAEPVLIDERVIAVLDALTPLAPLHQPHHIAAIRAAADAAPAVPQIACLDTAFHQTQSRLAQEFALPRALTTKGVRRYGFHRLSYEYIVSALAEIAPEATRGKLV